MARKSRASGWRSRDPLFRGDVAAGLSPIDPGADRSIVRHVMQFDGVGRATPYQSVTEDRGHAAYFAGSAGNVYTGTVAEASAESVAHRSQVDLLNLLVGRGHGQARWPNAFEVMQARKLVVKWTEHLFGYYTLPSPSRAAAAAARILR